jgi:serine/threonine protein kinase
VVYALKTFRDEFLDNPKAREAFKKEALLWVNLEDHPFILPAKFVVEISGRLFVFMEYIAPDAQGRANLADHLAQTVGPLDTGHTLKWAFQFCLGMEHAQGHGIQCHRDIKPANIFITKDGSLRIGDFGLSRAAETAWCQSHSHNGSLVKGSGENSFCLMQSDGKFRSGTPGYMAPEVYRFEGADYLGLRFRRLLALEFGPRSYYLIDKGVTKSIARREVHENPVKTDTILVRREAVFNFVQSTKQVLLWCVRSQRYSERNLDELGLKPKAESFRQERYCYDFEPMNLNGRQKAELPRMVTMTQVFGKGIVRLCHC